MPDIGRQSPPEDDNVRGWKEIAQFLHSSERTVQRWEHTLRLPVHRIGALGNAIVLASRRELAIWFDSIEVRRALSEQSGQDPLGEPDADSASGDAGVSARDSLTPTILAQAPAALEAAENRAGVEERPARRRILWAALALVVIALLVGLVPLSKAMGWNWFGDEKKASSSTARPVGGGGTEASGPSNASKVTEVSVRFTADNGSSATIRMPVGGTSSMTYRNQPTYVFSAELTTEGLLLHVSRRNDGAKPDAPQLTELATITLRQGTPVPVDRMPGVSALEWADSATPSANRATASK